MGKDQRRELHGILKPLAPNVYFQPGEKSTLKYPCIIYSIEGVNSGYADNLRYKKATRYTVTAIDTDPDSEIWEKILELPHTNLEQVIIIDQLYHWNITLYY